MTNGRRHNQWAIVFAVVAEPGAKAPLKRQPVGQRDNRPVRGRNAKAQSVTTNEAEARNEQAALGAKHDTKVCVWTHA